MKNIVCIFLFFSFNTFAQHQHLIKGIVPSSADKKVSLKGFTIEGDTLIFETKADLNGNFILKYPSSYVGAALMDINGLKSSIIILNKENFELKWDKPKESNELSFVNSKENTIFYEGLKMYENAEGKKAALAYLLPLYEKSETKERDFITAEFERQNQIRAKYMEGLPENTYVSYYLKVRNLLVDVSLTPSRFPERVSDNEKDFNALNFGDKRLLRSGMYKQLFELYFPLLETYGVDKKYEHINFSIDAILRSVKSNPKVLGVFSENLFNFLEQRSLFPASEHLALAMLNDNDCHLDDNHKSLFEQYRKMATGKIAPEIVFETPVNGINKLSDIKNKYRLVAFGSSWCHKCATEIPKFKTFYQDWKSKNDLEILFISLDTDKAAYEKFAASFPGVKVCDFKMWDTKAVKDYCVFATPTFYLIDQFNKILLKPSSLEELDGWLKVH
ncbi:MAG: thioredoxin family protein [Sphingobacteriaceae bacterium]|nr:thioredoxin family protein [Sphingobacteriaceae bacterium]